LVVTRVEHWELMKDYYSVALKAEAMVERKDIWKVA
jgi:hypothetical protein